MAKRKSLAERKVSRRSRLEKSRQQLKTVRRLSERGKSQAAIARKIGVTRQRVQYIVKKMREGMTDVNTVGRPLNGDGEKCNPLFRHIGNICRETRINKDWNQGDIAERSGKRLNVSDISMFERGLIGLTHDKLAEMLSILGLTLDGVWPRWHKTPETIAKVLGITPEQAVDVLVYVDKLRK